MVTKSLNQIKLISEKRAFKSDGIIFSKGISSLVFSGTTMIHVLNKPDKTSAGLLRSFYKNSLIWLQNHRKQYFALDKLVHSAQRDVIFGPTVCTFATMGHWKTLKMKRPPPARNGTLKTLINYQYLNRIFQRLFIVISGFCLTWKKNYYFLNKTFL